MNSRIIAVCGIDIHYLEKNPDAAETIVFIHGNSSSALSWDKQLKDPMFDQYRLLALDLPGHGLSGQSKNPDRDYSVTGTALVVTDALNQLLVEERFLLVGFSYGTNVIAEMINYDMQPKGIVLAGCCVLGKEYPMDRVFLPSSSPSIYFYNETNKQVINSFLSSEICSASDSEVTELTESYFKTDPEFRPALLKSAMEGKISDEIQLLNRLDVPTCIIFGASDHVVSINYLSDSPFSFWKDTVIALPDAGHYVTIDASKEFNLTLFEYAQQIFRKK